MYICLLKSVLMKVALKILFLFMHIQNKYLNDNVEVNLLIYEY